MGCNGSKGNPDEIHYEMKKTQIPELDEFFNTASEVLKNLEEIRANFKEPREEMHEIGRLDELKEPKLVEALRVFFWSVSAHKDGKIIDAKLKWEVNPPTFTVECGDMNYHTWDFADAIERFIAGFTAAPARIVEIASKMKEVGDKSVELSKSIKEKVDASGLGAGDKMKASINAAGNCKTIADGVAKSPTILKESQEAIKEMQEALPHIGDLIAKADEVGKQAHDKKMKTIDEIFDHFQPQEKKKTPEQIKEDKKKKKGKKPRVSKHAHAHAKPATGAK